MNDGVSTPNLWKDPDWKIATVGDYNNDQIDDVVMRNSDGPAYWRFFMSSGAGYTVTTYSQSDLQPDKWKVVQSIYADDALEPVPAIMRALPG